MKCVNLLHFVACFTVIMVMIVTFNGLIGYIGDIGDIIIEQPQCDEIFQVKTV